MAVLSKDLGPVTAYAAAVNRGYTGTREEFEELMASYATVAEQAAESAAEASAAAEAAQQAGTSAGGSATAAEAAQAAAQSAANLATQSAASAQADASAASGSATAAAQSAASAAESQQTTQQTAQDFEETAQQAVSDVNAAGTNQKELARRQAQNSEAWAVGQRDGDDVGVSDPTYHNNSKWYAQQAGTSEQSAGQSATGAASSAQAAAQSAAEAAESARTLQIDESLTEPGQAAAADKTGAVRDAFEALGMSVVDGKPCMTFLTDEEVEG